MPPQSAFSSLSPAATSLTILDSSERRHRHHLATVGSARIVWQVRASTSQSYLSITVAIVGAPSVSRSFLSPFAECGPHQLWSAHSIPSLVVRLIADSVSFARNEATFRLVSVDAFGLVAVIASGRALAYGCVQVRPALLHGQSTILWTFCGGCSDLSLGSWSWKLRLETYRKLVDLYLQAFSNELAQRATWYPSVSNEYLYWNVSSRARSNLNFAWIVWNSSDNYKHMVFLRYEYANEFLNWNPTRNVCCKAHTKKVSRPCGPTNVFWALNYLRIACCSHRQDKCISVHRVSLNACGVKNCLGTSWRNLIHDMWIRRLLHCLIYEK